ncbi:MAG: FecR domain-containing protein, partial [Bacteroidota bacterium]
MDSEDLLIKYFSGNSSEEEKKAVEEWADASKENMEEFQSFKDVWSLTNPQRFNAEKGWDSLSGKISRKTVVREMPAAVGERSYFLKIAAAVVVLVVASLVMYNYVINVDSNNAISHKVNSVIKRTEKDVFLADGTKLFLAESGQLTYKSDFYKDNQRKVLLSGQAFFDIKENKEKPFIIETNNASIEVTGTSFLVTEYNGYTEVIVKSGSVKLTKNDGDTYLALKKGDVGIASADSNGLYKRKNTNANYLSWMTGSFDFQDGMPLEEVFELLQEHYHVEIVVKNEAVIRCKYAATFTNRSI